MGDEVTIRPIKPGDRLSGLSLGVTEFQPLKTFLRRDAAKYHAANLAKTYGAFLSSRPDNAVGYVTLVCGEIGTDARLRTVETTEFTYDHYPALEIARLAVNKALQGQGIGRRLTRLALGIAKEEICPRVGCRFVTLDAKKLSIEFYRKEGFVLLDTEDNLAREHPVMFFDLNHHP
ncbi:MAG: GNAT family N-acetyltransferase [Reyranellaceae bacterium]